MSDAEGRRRMRHRIAYRVCGRVEGVDLLLLRGGQGEGAFRGRLRLTADVLVPLLLLPSVLLLLALLLVSTGRMEAQAGVVNSAPGVGVALPGQSGTAAGLAAVKTGQAVVSADVVSSQQANTVAVVSGQPLGEVPGGRKKSLSEKVGITSPNMAASSLNTYLNRVRTETITVVAAPGSIWTETGRLTRMTTDVRAMRPNDLISVVVEENLAASTDGTVKNQRASTASSGISGLLGTLHSGNALQNLLDQTSSNSLAAQGASAVNSSLTTTFGGQVIEVLPNGMLVIEAARQVEFSQQTQTVLLRGLVRPEDISQQNQVLSTAISSLELEVKGKGIVNDYTRRQNPVVRFLQQILVF